MTFQHMLMAEIGDGSSGNLLKELNITEERAKELLDLLDNDVKKQLEGGLPGQRLVFNSLAAIVKHIEDGDISDSELLFMIHTAYLSRTAERRIKARSSEHGFDAGYMAAKMGLQKELAEKVYQQATGISPNLRLDDSTEIAMEDPTEIKSPYRTRGKDTEEGK